MDHSDSTVLDARDLTEESLIDAVVYGAEDEKIGMVILYSKQQVIHNLATNAALFAKGQEYYEKSCFRCHGTESRGNEKIARLAGQQASYLNATLKHYRDGSNLRNNPVMADNTRLMADADIAAVGSYISAME